jgi:hypothetical protein
MPAVLAPAPTVVEVPPAAAAPEPVVEEQAQATERRKKNRDR